MTGMTKLLRRTEVESVTGLSRSGIYRGMEVGDFPRPVQIGPRSIAWRSDDVQAWIESRTAPSIPAPPPRKRREKAQAAPAAAA